MSKEDAINKLYATIKSKFESDGVMQELRCMLQSKMVAMMKGKTMEGGATSRHYHPFRTASQQGNDEDEDIGDANSTTMANSQRDERLHMLHQLIMDYLHWHGFEYTAEMFAIETASANTRPNRQNLESQLSGMAFKHKSLPILLELIANLMECSK